MIGENKYGIASEIVSHFKISHNAFPNPNPYFLDISDFERNLVYLMSDSGGSFPYTSRLFCSEDYYVAVITWSNYYDCVRDKSQRNLHTWLSDYFPNEV
jgi:hypothetical protein